MAEFGFVRRGRTFASFGLAHTEGDTIPPSMRSQYIMCRLCYSNVPKTSLHPASPRCAHGPLYCKECLMLYMQTAIHGGDLERIRCPLYTCDVVLGYEDIRQLSHPTAFQHYDRMLLQRTLADSPTFRWCKNPYCHGGQDHVPHDTQPIMCCHFCGTLACYPHDTVWHEGVTCTQYDALRQDDVTATAATIDHSTKPCPKCARRIEKSEGCEHMTCRPPGGCGHQFCWLCLADYGPILREGSPHHNPTCPFYPNPRTPPLPEEIHLAGGILDFDGLDDGFATDDLEGLERVQPAAGVNFQEEEGDLWGDNGFGGSMEFLPAFELLFRA